MYTVVRVTPTSVVVQTDKGLQHHFSCPIEKKPTKDTVVRMRTVNANEHAAAVTHNLGKAKMVAVEALQKLRGGRA